MTHETSEQEPLSSEENKPGTELNLDKSEIGQNDELEMLAKMVATLKAELDESKKGLLMARADFDNSRKRMERDKAEAIKFGLERVFKDLLPSLDVLDKALAESPTDEASRAYVQGFEMIRNQVYDALKKHGLEKLEAEGQSFNPDFHQAIQRVESETVTSDTVKDVFMNGFSYNGRVLRPAMVSVYVPLSE
jgi:molecular chaperone GrpE